LGVRSGCGGGCFLHEHGVEHSGRDGAAILPRNRYSSSEEDVEASGWGHGCVEAQLRCCLGQVRAEPKFWNFVGSGARSAGNSQDESSRLNEGKIYSSDPEVARHCTTYSR
jgi:hypothetical protein